MSDHPSQAIQQNQIPKVKDLCQALGFGNTYRRTEQDLKDSTHSWRKQYKTSDGISGKDLTDWRSAKTRDDLRRMSKDYLEAGGYGIIHWPSKGNATPRAVLEYPRDELRILNLLTQLFWRENLNQAHNAKIPDRGRRLHENVESDRSSPPTIGNPPLSFPPYNYARSTSGALSAGPLNKAPQPRPPFPYNEGATEKPPFHRPTQNSGPLHNPSTSHNGNDSDVRRQGHNKLSKIIVLKANPQVRDDDDTREEPSKPAAVANMQVAPTKSLTTLTKSRPERD